MPLVDVLKQSHEALMAAVPGLKVKELETPQSIGDRSICDVLLLSVMCDGEVLKNLAIWRAGGAVGWAYVKDRKGILRFNDFWIGTMTHLSVRKPRQMLTDILTALIAGLTAVVEWPGKRKSPPRWRRQISVDLHRAHVKKTLAYHKTLGK